VLEVFEVAFPRIDWKSGRLIASRRANVVRFDGAGKRKRLGRLPWRSIAIALKPATGLSLDGCRVLGTYPQFVKNPESTH
jgi:hypothetical protein